VLFFSEITLFLFLFLERRRLPPYSFSFPRIFSFPRRVFLLPHGRSSPLSLPQSENNYGLPENVNFRWFLALCPHQSLNPFQIRLKKETLGRNFLPLHHYSFRFGFPRIQKKSNS
ncbi:hypothetical protein AABB24_012547, partial [Solanum stoloniferum]